MSFLAFSLVLPHIIEELCREFPLLEEGHHGLLLLHLFRLHLRASGAPGEHHLVQRKSKLNQRHQHVLRIHKVQWWNVVHLRLLVQNRSSMPKLLRGRIPQQQ